jgi:hypothetical protein
MNLQTVMILVGAVAVIGVVAILFKRGILGGTKTAETPAGAAKP